MKILRLIQWALTALLAFGVLSALTDGPTIFAIASVFSGLALAAVWGIPWAIRRERSTVDVTFEDGFKPEMMHSHIALDTTQNRLWIRDPKKGERYLAPGDILGIKTAQDWNNGNFRQRLEFRLNDVRDPLWFVMFQRHSDRLVRTSKRNTAERDEWFARVQNWAGMRSTG